MVVVAVILALTALPGAAHWTDPAVIVAGMQNDVQLRERAGVFDVSRDKRLLVIRVLRVKWDAVPDEQRANLAREWRANWQHNVPGGIVAIVDATNDRPLVNYDGNGQPRLAPAATP